MSFRNNDHENQYDQWYVCNLKSMNALQIGLLELSDIVKQ